jgi:hypothetical protein
MISRRLSQGCLSASLAFAIVLLAGCGGGNVSGTSRPIAALSSTGEDTSTTGRVSTLSTATVTNGVTNRPQFVGAFFRPEGPPPFGIFSSQASNVAPVPYPTPGAVLTGPAGYCDKIAANRTSIDKSYAIDSTKLSDLIYLGARWSRMPSSQYFIDNSHVFGAGSYAWGTLDAAQCVSYIYHGIKPIIGIEAGPVNYNAVPGSFSPTQMPTYETAGDFAQWCGAVAAHEKAAFPTVTEYSIPGNEVNSDPATFPGGVTQIATYTKACYSAIKAVNPGAFIYGLELNTTANLNPAGFVRQLVALGCGVGTCYDGIAMHLDLLYPVPPSSAPCFPNPGGSYSMQCVTDIEKAAGGNVHALISETEYTVPGNVPDEQTKASATVAEFTAFAANPTIDGVLYANVDECGLYPSGYFFDGCLMSTAGVDLPAWSALQWLAGSHFL